MKPVIFYRKGVPFFYKKTPLEFQKDVYERYDEMVVRQSALHLADELWGNYPFQPIFDFAKKHYPKSLEGSIVEIGCGVGRWIATLAQSYPEATCWGIDYSYQMLKRANEYWIESKDISIDISDRGFAPTTIKGQSLGNLQFGLAKAEVLPFEDESQDLILSSFLIDRLENPLEGLQEMYRILKPSGQIIIVTPLNFNKSQNWQMYYPPVRLSNELKAIGFEILDCEENIIVEELLDAHGNKVSWKCLGFVLKKKNLKV